MIKCIIDNKEVLVEEGTTIMEAAASIGIEIPSMCYLKGHHNHPSCMICLVKELHAENLLPSCAIPVKEGMNIITRNDEIELARKDALELLLSDHVGDCEAPCRYGCPAFMNIPLMNRLIAGQKFDEALAIVKKDIAIPIVLGYICEAPCEKVCRRKDIDKAVSICQLKRFVSLYDISGLKSSLPEKEISSGKKVVIIGAGPAGLSVAFYLTRGGHQCTVYDKNSMAGGSLLKVTSDVLPPEKLKNEVDILNNYGVEFILNRKINADDLINLNKNNDAVILATGKDEETELMNLDTDNKGVKIDTASFMTSTNGLFACGSVVKEQKMAVKAVAHAKEAAISIHSYLLKQSPELQTRQFNSKFGRLKENEHSEYLKEASEEHRIEPEKGWIKGFSKEEAVREAKRCMHCDCRKPDTCKLRIYADEYGADRRKYIPEERNSVTKLHTHSDIVYEPEKCIKCGLCIDIASGEKELTGLTFIGRGFDVKVSIPFNKTLDEALTVAAHKCAEACPTGAISFKDNKL